MDIRTLASTPFPVLTATFNEAFSDYFVPFHLTEEALRNKWAANRVDLGLSFGMFDGERLVAFIIFGIDTLDGRLTAYNAGTGVIPAHRGQKLVKQLYDHALPILAAAGIRHTTLEVITKNAKAIKAYRGIGYEVRRLLHCFNGTATSTISLPDTYEVVRKKDMIWDELAGLDTFYFSWEYTRAAIDLVAAMHECILLKENGTLKAFAIMNPANGNIAQYGFMKNDIDTGRYLLAALGQHYPALRLINVDSNEQAILEVVRAAGLTNHIDQYEMAMPV